MFDIGMPELMVILVIVMVIFGAGKLPRIGENLGRAIRNFKNATQENEESAAPPPKADSILEKR